MNIKKCIGQRIKELRKRNGLSQEKLAEKLDISQNAMSFIENGKNFITSDTLEKLLTVFEVEPEELFNFKSFQPRTDLMREIISMLEKQPDKITDIYKITRALTL